MCNRKKCTDIQLCMTALSRLTHALEIEITTFDKTVNGKNYIEHIHKFYILVAAIYTSTLSRIYLKSYPPQTTSW